ncbi:TBC1 domain family member 10B [Gouania willdenowi]|uniref:Rab-GAP TBC domain-containing protein n=1 Tax=Gouania willdenowi TaxID=441366 RepID=A0A8C5E4N8_GOUWI|nr:TBC1 domain family member 10B [Gouania willdenowi]XP_028311115.1 TBC1 domain family member 10B [Gouania willdenowi]
MAELSTLSPSPPALMDPLAAPSIPLSSDSTLEIPNPKCSSYSDTASIGNAPPAAQAPPSAPSPPKLTADDPPAPSLAHEAAPLKEESVEIEADPGFDKIIQEMTSTDPKTVPETSAVQSPSPDSNPAPILYPSVHITQTPNPVVLPQLTTVSSPPSAPSAPSAPSEPPVLSESLAPLAPSAPSASSAPLAPSEPSVPSAEEEEPQILPQAQTSTSDPPPISPKPPSDSGKDELPVTPTRTEPHSPTVIPHIQEPMSAGPPPNLRSAPDTLSYLESASLMSGTLESLSGLGEDGSSVGSDSEINGLTVRRIDKYGFLGGSQYSDATEKDIRVEVARQREMKWLEMFNNWDKWIKHRFQKVKLRCRKGIPSSLRGKAWQLLSNSQELLQANPGKFEELEREPGEAKWLDIIEKDLHRQFPFHEMFAARGGHGQQDLYRILKAYTIYRPDEGYCQAQAPVAAVLLMHMPAEQAFWCLVQICEKFLPGYYSAGLEAIQLDGEIFFSLLRRTCPMAYRHLKKFKIDPILYMTEWFMCIFSRTLPWSCVLRVWDMFFCEGVKIVFRVGLVLLKQMLGSVDKLRELQGMYETMERLRSISPDMIREDVLVQEIVTLQVTEALIERESSVQVRKWRESRGELTHQPGRRLHGTRAIFENKRRAAAISSGGSYSFLGGSAPPPGPLRASSSLLSLPGFRKSKGPFRSQHKKGSFSGPSGTDGLPPRSPPAAAAGPSQGPAHKPPIPPGAGQRVPSPLVSSPVSSPREAQPAPTAPNTLSPLIVSEHITPTLPSPMANNATLAPHPEPKKEDVTRNETPPPAAVAAAVEEDGKKKKRSKEDKRKEKEDERKRLKEKKEKEKAEKERLRKEKERLEKEKKRSVKKKERAVGGESEDKNGAAAAKNTT